MYGGCIIAYRNPCQGFIQEKYFWGEVTASCFKGGLGACPFRKFLKFRCSESESGEFYIISVTGSVKGSSYQLLIMHDVILASLWGGGEARVFGGGSFSVSVCLHIHTLIWLCCLTVCGVQCDYCIFRSLACRVCVARQWSLRQLISTTMMIPADTDFAIRGVWDSTDYVQLHVAITFLNDVIMKTVS